MKFKNGAVRKLFEKTLESLSGNEKLADRFVRNLYQIYLSKALTENETCKDDFAISRSDILNTFQVI